MQVYRYSGQVFKNPSLLNDMPVYTIPVWTPYYRGIRVYAGIPVFRTSFKNPSLLNDMPVYRYEPHITAVLGFM